MGDEHGDVCDDCEGTGRVPTPSGLRLQDCDDCSSSGIIWGDDETCSLVQCDLCSNPALADDPAAKFR